jgi:hypothetical protein
MTASFIFEFLMIIWLRFLCHDKRHNKYPLMPITKLVLLAGGFPVGIGLIDEVARMPNACRGFPAYRRLQGDVPAGLRADLL